MSPTFITKYHLFFAIGVSLISIVVSCFFINSSVTTAVFCDVGQGDGAYIRTKKGIDIVVDAGPDNRMLSCIGKYMPFYDRTIEIAILSHPQRDHMGGFPALFDRYRVRMFLMGSTFTPESTFLNLMRKVQNSNTPVYFLSSGSKVTVSSDTFLYILWPEKMDSLQKKTDDNYYSLIFFYEENGKRMLFTGDASKEALQRILLENFDLSTSVLKVPHHGSKNGLTRQFLSLANPYLSVISVGKNNSYGHPSKEILDLFQALKKKYRRTDEEGDIVIKLK